MIKKHYQNTSHWLDAISNPWYKIILEIEETIILETNNFCRKKDIHNLILPVTTGSISSPMGLGSDSLPVQVNVCGRKTYLADSMQFLLEYGCRFFNSGCYYIMPAFRGEDVDSRHLAQFFHSEMEIPGNLDDIINLVDGYVKHLLKAILHKHEESIMQLVGSTKHIKNAISKDFKKISFNEAQKILQEKFPHDLNKYIKHTDKFRSITNAGEKALMEHFDGIVWITNFDNLAVPFYQKIDPQHPETAKNADLLMGIGETVGCGERNLTADELLRQINRHGVNKSEYRWYVEMRAKYPLQTSGFGMGIERFLLFILNHDDIRDIQLFLRFNRDSDIV